MCGIAGIVGTTQSASVEPAVIHQMCQMIIHRGPDDEGIYSSGHLVLGHRRLSLIDLSSAGHQPMSYADGRYVISFNGEIYNFFQLRNELIKEGYLFLKASIPFRILLVSIAKKSFSKCCTCISTFIPETSGISLILQEERASRILVNAISFFIL